MRLLRWLGRWLVALITLAFSRSPSRPEDEQKERIVPAGRPERRAETLVLVLLAIAVLWAIGFVVTYAEFSPRRLPNELLGICLGMSLLFIAAAFTVVAKRLVVTEELEDEYPEEHPEKQSEVAQIVHESGSRFTRKRLLIGASAATAVALGAAAATPAASLGPIWYTAPLDRTPWRRGRRLVDDRDHPYRADEIETETFYTAFPEGADREELGSSVVVVRLDPKAIQLPPGRDGWAPEGIVAYSKICTHAGCAIALYRKPTFPVVEPEPALVCPCHYSTFNPATGGNVLYGPAGRPLPQLPLMIDGAGFVRAAGNLSGRPGPGWWNVREPAT
jgi:ubiquinol-cytochrome c reductase iron-sulfur subunit